MADVTINVAVQINQAINNFNHLQQQLNQAASRMSNTFNQSNNSLSRFNNSATGMFSNMRSGFNSMDLQMRGISANLIALGITAVAVGKKFGDFFNRGVDMEVFRTRMATLSGGVNAAQDSIKNVFELAKNVPFSLDSITESFTRLKSAGIEPISGANGDGPLRTMMDAFASFGASSEEFKRGIYAITQMAGKGTVSMEELRQQLGEAMPTSMRIAAKSMGMTVGEFVDKVSKGKIAFTDFFDKFINLTEKVYGGNATKFISTFRGALAQLDTAFTRVADQLLNNSGIMHKFTALVQLATTKMYEFISFLDTPAGVVWIDQIWQSFEKTARWIAAAIVPAQNLITTIGNIATAVAHVTGSMPAEIVGGGILGFVLFGTKGIALGAAYAAFSDELAKSSAATGAFLATVQELFTAAMGSSIGSSAVIGGVIGFYTFGPKGALAGAAIGATYAARAEIAKFVIDVMSMFATLGAFVKNLFDPTKFGTELPSFNELYGEAQKKLLEDMSGSLGVLGDIAHTANNDLKGDLPDNINRIGDGIANVGSKAKENLNAVNKFFDNLNEQTSKVDAAQGADPLSSLSENIHKSLAKVEVDFGQTGKVIYDSQQEALTKIMEYGQTISEQMAIAQKGIDDSMASGDLVKQGLFEEYAQNLNKLAAQVESEAKRIGSVKLGNVADEFDKVKNSITEFSTSIPQSFENQATLTKQLELLRDRVDEYKTSLENANLTDEQRAEITSHLTELEAEYAAAQKLVTEHVDDKPYIKQTKAKKDAADASDKLARAEARSNNAAEAAKVKIDSLTQSVNSMLSEAGMDDEAAKVQQKTDEIQKLLDQITQEIVRIQGLSNTGVLSPEAANADIAKLEAIRAKLQEGSAAVIDSVTASGQAWKSFMSTVTSAMESSISDALYGLVTGTKSAKDVLLDFYHAITKAVTDYLAKQIMIGLFGGGGIGSGGGLLGFAAGGSFMVDGRGGVDQNIVAFKASKGERVSIQTKEQQKNMGGGGDTFIIHAVDAASVAELFMRNGSALHAAMNQRTRLNHR
jgi:tape measure domain-containing protein